MAKQTINIGSGELQGDGESVRSAFDKINQNFTELYNNTGLGGSSDRLTANGDELILTGGADPYVTFPAITGGNQLAIQGSEIATLSGTLALTSLSDIALNTNGANAGGIGSQVWNFGADGNLTVPDAGSITGSNDFTVKSSVDGNSSGVFLNGNTLVGSAMLYGHNNAIIRSDYDGDSKDWVFNKQGDLELPNKWPIQFSPVFDAAHYTGGGTFQGDGTASFTIELQGQGATFQWLADDPTFNSNRGYVGQQQFSYTEEDHGITGYTLDILMEMTGPSGGLYSLNVALSQVPTVSDLAKIRSGEELMISADTKGWLFDTQGDLYLPAAGTIRDSAGNDLLGGGGSTGDFTFTTTTATVPNGDTMTLQANYADGLLGGQLRMSPDSGRVQLIAGAAESSQLYTGAWSTATYTGTEVSFADAASMISWIETSNWAIAYNKKFSINGGAKLPYDGYSGGGNNITIYTSVAADPDPTTVTSIEFFYHLQSSIDIDYDDGRFDVYSTMSIYIDNSDVQGPDIWLRSGDDITLQAKDKTTSDTEGGDINIYAGNGGPGDVGDGGGTGGDLQIRAGAGGDASTSYQAGQGGFFQIRGGVGGAANASQNAGAGGYVTITAGNGGNISQATANQGGAGGYIEIVAGDSTRQSEPGGYVLITSGGAGPGALAGAVDISIDASDLGPGGNWSFNGAGNILNVPANAEIFGANAGTLTMGSTGNVIIRSVAAGPVTNDWTFNTAGGIDLPGGGSIATNNEDVALIAGNDGASTFGSVTINTQFPAASYTVVQQSSPGAFDAVYTTIAETPNIASIVAGMTVTGSGITLPTTVTSVTGPDGFGTYTINLTANGVDLLYLQTYTFTAVEPQDRNWEFNSLGEMYLPQGGAIQENTITHELFGSTTTAITLIPGGAAPGSDQRLEIYGTAGGEGDHIHIRSGNQSATDLYLGNDSQYFSVGAAGQNRVQARDGIDSPSPGMGAGAGGSIYIYAGHGGSNGGDPADGAGGGDVIIKAGDGTNGYGASAFVRSGEGDVLNGDVVIDTRSYLWTFRDNTIIFPDSTVQTTAFTGSTSALDITDTNGLTTTYYPTFVENRTTGQTVRADTNLTYRTDTNTLGLGALSFSGEPLRIISTSPSSSTGTTGDRKGDTNFSHEYLYYCIANYASGGKEVTIQATNTTFVHIYKADYPNLETLKSGNPGTWTITDGTNTYTINSVTTSGLISDAWELQLASNPDPDFANGSTAVINASSYTYPIWRRLQWSTLPW